MISRSSISPQSLINQSRLNLKNGLRCDTSCIPIQAASMLSLKTGIPEKTYWVHLNSISMRRNSTDSWKLMKTVTRMKERWVPKLAWSWRFSFSWKWARPPITRLKIKTRVNDSMCINYQHCSYQEVIYCDHGWGVRVNQCHFHRMHYVHLPSWWSARTARKPLLDLRYDLPLGEQSETVLRLLGRSSRKI